MCVAPFFYERYAQSVPYQVYCLAMKRGKFNPHPNVLPIIEVSEKLFPLCIVSPWMPDGDIAQYIQMNPGAERLTLVHDHQPGY